ncbi:MAG: nucleotidyltransferase family protein [Vicinamibacteria bacterium]
MARPPLLDLVDAYRAGRTDYPADRLTPARLAWAIESGLAPVLARTSASFLRAGGPDADAVRGADLAARVVADDQSDATVALIDACRGRVGPLTLLKGIWLRHALHPEPHLRPMRDVDVLVEPAEVAEVEDVLRGLGYLPAVEPDVDDYHGHHHAVPYRHPLTGVVFEVHRALVPAAGPFGTDPMFDLGYVHSHLTDDTFRGRRVRRLADGLLLAHMAAHWSSSFKVVGGAGGLVVLLDLLALAGRVDWPRAAADLRGSTAVRSLWLLLGYLEARGLRTLAPDVRALVRPPLGAADGVALALLHAMMDVRVADGRPYGRAVFTRRTFEIVWKTLLLPRPSALNLASLPWRLLPSRWTGRSD